ncbi:hypothetical protein QFC19_004233 [Naganishia cerealis]|uniref:Uncharacterized protein n=1 Tax=Naganishia cerealis TaxID=610337 RepID=A0ACC2VW64_9TREE|nr:hypothetical protein QFC19_004233 [Naganishia cerealis]
MPGAASHYKDMSSSDAFATPSIVPPNILPPAVQTSYQPAPFRSQHYQRLLAAKLANSGQIGQESNANDAAAAASFMQNWGDHLLDPNFPTPQEMSFLPSSQSPLYQLFTSGHTQDQWQDGGSFQEPTAVRPTAESMAPNSFTSGHYAASGNSSRQIPSANHFQRPEAGSSASSNTSYLQVSESGNKYVPWINPYAQAAEVNDATSVESSRAPGHHYPNGREMQRGEDAMFREPVHTAAAAPASEPAPSSHQSGNQEMHDMSANPYGEENAPSPDNNANTTFTDDGGEEGEEPKKAVLACHFCRGRKLK